MRPPTASSPGFAPLSPERRCADFQEALRLEPANEFVKQELKKVQDALKAAPPPQKPVSVRVRSACEVRRLWGCVEETDRYLCECETLVLSNAPS